MAFFLWAIFGMSAAALHDFLESPYNRLADVKMGLFFAGYFGARAFGVWDNKISDGEYVRRIQKNQIDPYGHPGM